MASEETSTSATPGDPSESNQIVEADAPKVLIASETRSVGRTRFLLFALLGLAAIGCSIAAYKYIDNTERRAFRQTFDDLAERTKDSFLATFYQRFQLGRSLAATVAEMWKLQNAPMSEFSMDDSAWDELTLPLRVGFRAILVSFSPILEGDHERRAFEAMARNQTFRLGPYPQCLLCGSDNLTVSNAEVNYHIPGWGTANCGYSQDIALSGGYPGPTCPVIKHLATVEGGCVCAALPEGATQLSVEAEIPDQVFSFVAEERVPVPYNNETYAPMWQTSGFTEYRFNLMFDQMFEERRAVAINETLGMNIPTMTGIIDRTTDEYRIGRPGRTVGRPGMVQYSPIVDREAKKIIGLVSTESSFYSQFPLGLPPLCGLLDIYIESTCGGIRHFTFEAETYVLHYSGPVDKVPEPFDGYAIASTSFEDYQATLESILGSRGKLPEGYTLSCEYRIHLVAQEALWLDLFHTSTPLSAAIAVNGIFLVTSLVFWLYDWLVRKRQAKVMNAANRTTAIVADMFPQHVRERLYEEQTKTASATDDKELQFGEEIAELYPSVTVMVFSVVGFDVWSS